MKVFSPMQHVWVKVRDLREFKEENWAPGIYMGPCLSYPHHAVRVNGQMRRFCDEYIITAEAYTALALTV